VPFPKGAFGFYSHHGLTDEAFARRNTELKAAGFRQGWQQRVECGGRGYNQGTWTKP
jgi:hypothetical protein